MHSGCWWWRWWLARVCPFDSTKFENTLQVVIDAFRLINPQLMMLGQEPRQTTSNVGHLNKPSIQALIHGLNRHYYSIGINYRKNELEQKMLLNLHKKQWTDGLKIESFEVCLVACEKQRVYLFAVGYLFAGC